MRMSGRAPAALAGSGSAMNCGAGAGAPVSSADDAIRCCRRQACTILAYMSLSTKDYPEVCEYPDSGKLMAFSWKDGVNTVRSVHHKPTAVDCWEGEP
jgi:uncharacterized cupin superfamily protein